MADQRKAARNCRSGTLRWVHAQQRLAYIMAGMEDSRKVVRRVFLARHGERVDHVDREWARSAKLPHDPPLTDRGRRQAYELGVFLRKVGNVCTILSSPFARTLETANCVAEELKLPVYVEHGTSEWLNASWFGERRPELESQSQLKKRLPRLDLEAHQSVIFPNYPEDINQLASRCKETIQTIVRKYPVGDLLVVGHGISVQFMAEGLCGPETKVEWIGYCAVCECILESTQETNAIERDGDSGPASTWRLGRNADSSFLSEPEDLRHIHYI